MPGLAPYKAKLAAGQRVTVNARGTTIFLRKATGEISVEVRSLAVGDADGSSYTLRMEQAEEWLHADTFDAVVLTNELAVENVIELYLGFGRFIKPVPDVVNVAIGVPLITVSLADLDLTNVSIGNAGKVAIANFNALRVSLIITALATNTDTIRIGHSSVDVNRGIPLAAGESLKWDSPAACFACSEAVANQSLGRLRHLIS